MERIEWSVANAGAIVAGGLGWKGKASDLVARFHTPSVAPSAEGHRVLAIVLANLPGAIVETW